MRSLLLMPVRPGSLRLQDPPDPPEKEGRVLGQPLHVGLCGTDAEIISRQYGEAPPRADFLVPGHENLGQVLEAPAVSLVAAGEGELAGGTVRRPDPVPRPACAVGEWTVPAAAGTSSTAFRLCTAWRARAGARRRMPSSSNQPSAVITSAGPVGLLAALFAARRALEADVFDRGLTGPGPDLVRALGVTDHAQPVPESGVEGGVVVECTGVPSAVFEVMEHSDTASVVCLTGVSSIGVSSRVDMGDLNRSTVLDDDVVFGCLNANRRHDEAASSALAEADRDWLSRLNSRRLPLDQYASALTRQYDYVEVVLDVQAG